LSKRTDLPTGNIVDSEQSDESSSDCGLLTSSAKAMTEQESNEQDLECQTYSRDDRERREAIVIESDLEVSKRETKKAAKAMRRLKRESKTDLSGGQKPCHICSKEVDLLIRCQVDITRDWKMVCGKCWNRVSGGVPDGDTDHPYYRYGGVWKNK